VAVFVTPTHFICANAGDSRSVYCKGSVVALSEDHKPDNPDERARIERAGGHVAQGMMGMGPMRVDGDLAVSRCLGDFEYKQNKRLPPVEQKVSPLPECRICQRDPSKDELLILACDGIWDVMTNQECCDALRQLLLEGEKDMGNVAEECLMMCLDKESKDNMSAVVVAFPAAKYGSGPGVAGRAATREARERADEAQGGAAAGQPSRRR
jgi:serine/threonine protein phosphatase PrpC